MAQHAITGGAAPHRLSGRRPPGRALARPGLRQVLRGCPSRRDLADFIATLSAAESRALLHHWPLDRGREDQYPPEAGGHDSRPDPAGDWTLWLVLGGRGAGKTRTGAEWVRGMALGHPGFTEPAPGASR